MGLQGIGVGMREWGWECGNLAGYAGNVKNGVGMRESDWKCQEYGSNAWNLGGNAGNRIEIGKTK